MLLVMIGGYTGDLTIDFPDQTPQFPLQLAEALHGEDHVEIYRATAATDQTKNVPTGLVNFPTGFGR